MYEDEPSLEEMKRAVHILPLAVSFGLAPKKIGGGEYVVRCPFGKHEDSTPSCHINYHKNVFHCKGCGESGTVVDWLMLTEKIDLSSAIKRLKEEYHRTSSASAGQAVNSGKYESLLEIEEKQPQPINILEPRFQKALSLVVDFWHNNFNSKKEGAAYLMKRGIVFGELVEEFKTGFSDGSLSHVVNDPEILETLVELGILKSDTSRTAGEPKATSQGSTFGNSAGVNFSNGNGSLKEHFAGRVVFPVFDENGLVVQIYGRNISTAGPKHMLLSGVPLALFNTKALVSSEIILCESVIDALSIMAMGYRNVAGSLSVNGLKDDLFEKIISSGVKKVFIAFDNDLAGNIAAGNKIIEGKLTPPLAERLIAHKIESFRILFDENTDANDLLKKSKSIDSAREKMTELLESAHPLKQLTDTPALYEGGKAETLTKKGKEYVYKIGQREYTIRGLDQNKTDSVLKIFLRLDYEEPTKHEKRFHIDNSLDLFNAKTTGIFCRAAAVKLTLDDRVISSDLDSLTIKLDELLKKTIEEKESKKEIKKKQYHKNIETSFNAREFLSNPLFIVKFIKDMEKAGVVGEPLNMFFGFLSTLSRHMKYPLHLIIQSESSAGKSNMLNLLSKLVPEESMIYLTQVTPRSFYYGEEDYLKNKSIFIAEADGLKEAEFPIKQMMSEGRLAISSTRTDPKSGEHTTDTREIEGPSQFVITEPIESLVEEIINRCVTLVLDMSLKQTERIMDYQRLLHSPDGVLLRKQKEILCDFYRHVQREIQGLDVINTFSPFLSFNATTHQARRDHQKYLTLIDTITLLNQHQREKIYKDGRLCVKTHPVDIAEANFLARRIFARALDELPIQTRNFVEFLGKHYLDYAKANQVDFSQVWFYRKDAREITGLSNTRVHEHINRIVDFEYLTIRRDANGLGYRFLFEPNMERGFFTSLLKLVEMPEILKHASKKERQEYKDSAGYLQEIFKALDPSYETGEI
jgi:DNA primase